jgi:hypothetical protein
VFDHSACMSATLSTPRCHNSSISLLTVVIDVATDAMLAIDQMAVLLPGRQVSVAGVPTPKRYHRAAMFHANQH